MSTPSWQVRRSVRAVLAAVNPGDTVLAAVSGGADSMALAGGLVHEAPATALRAGAVVVDHQLQPGSGTVSRQVAGALTRLGLDPVEVVAVSVQGTGGPEAAARNARYAALEAAADRAGAALLLLGHTRDDQAESVLLGFARGAGARSVAGMPRRRGRFVRPLLDLPRQTTRAACEEWGLAVWDDPHNEDHRFARVRVRREVLPVMVQALGPEVVQALARTADRLRDDDAALEEWATRAGREAAGDEGSYDVVVLAQLPAAVRGRVLRQAALAAGVPGGSLGASHLAALDALVVDWHGQAAAHLPGGVRAERACGRLSLARPH